MIMADVFKSRLPSPCSLSDLVLSPSPSPFLAFFYSFLASFVAQGSNYLSELAQGICLSRRCAIVHHASVSRTPGHVPKYHDQYYCWS